MNQSNESKNVCVIGMGNMGSTLAKALLVKGYNVTVWNRTVSKCESLGEAAATVAPRSEISRSDNATTTIRNQARLMDCLRDDGNDYATIPGY